MRIRTIKPEFWTHPIMLRQDDSVRLAAIGLLNIADDEGYFLAEPAQIRSALWALDESSTNARRTLAQLVAIGWIEVRETRTHGPIGLVVNFTKHQRIDRASPSKLKTYFLDESSTINRRTLDDQSLLEQGTGNREQGTGEQGSACVRDPQHDLPDDSPSPPIEPTNDAEVWLYRVAGQPWAKELKRHGCKIGQKNWRAWEGLVARVFGGDASACAKAAATVPPADRWPDRVEAAAGPPDPQQQAADKVRSKYASVEARRMQ